jgi:hypothetical protein
MMICYLFLYAVIIKPIKAVLLLSHLVWVKRLEKSAVYRDNLTRPEHKVSWVNLIL